MIETDPAAYVSAKLDDDLTVSITTKQLVQHVLIL